MNQYPKWKYILVLLIVLIGLIYSIPNFFGESPAIQISPIKASGKVDINLSSEIESKLKESNLATNGFVLEPNSIKIKFDTTDNQIKAKDLLQSYLGVNYIVALNLISKSPSWLSAIGAVPMHLGLDLRGGVHFLLQVDLKAALEKNSESLLNELRSNFRKEKISYINSSRINDIVSIQFENKDDLKKAKLLLLNRNNKELNISELNNSIK
jgi:preprotein translocase subunit SecD